MPVKKLLRIFFLIASLLFSQYAAALHLFAHALQANDSVELTAEPKRDGDLAGKKLCEQCLTLAELGNGIASSSISLLLQQQAFHFPTVVQVTFSPQALFAFHSRAPPAQ